MFKKPLWSFFITFLTGIGIALYAIGDTLFFGMNGFFFYCFPVYLLSLLFIAKAFVNNDIGGIVMGIVCLLLSLHVVGLIVLEFLCGNVNAILLRTAENATTSSTIADYLHLISIFASMVLLSIYYVSVAIIFVFRKINKVA